MTEPTTSRFRSRKSARHLIALSISYEREPLLARGFGIEHLRELIVLLVRPLVRQGASLAYGGDWQERKDNFTYDLLRLVSTEQDEAAQREETGDAADTLPIGRLYNYSAWPYYLSITPSLEALWINSCRIVRVDQSMAGIPPSEQIPEGDFDPERDISRKPCNVPLNRAICLSAMRRLATDGATLTSPDVPRTESIPPVSARIVLGGKLCGFSGFMPGIFEEVLLALERQTPLFLLGGFGGATEAITNALLAFPGAPFPDELVLDWQIKHTPNLRALKNLRGPLPPSPDVIDTEAGLARLQTAISTARGNLALALGTGLDAEDTRELMSTCDMCRATALVHKGLINRKIMGLLSA